MMNSYTLDQLQDPQTYQNDEQLSRFCYDLAGSTQQLYSGTVSEIAEMFTSGAGRKALPISNTAGTAFAAMINLSFKIF